MLILDSNNSQAMAEVESLSNGNGKVIITLNQD